MVKPSPTSLRLDKDLRAWLQKRADAEHRTLTNLIEKVLLDYRETQERLSGRKK